MCLGDINKKCNCLFEMHDHGKGKAACLKCGWHDNDEINEKAKRKNHGALSKKTKKQAGQANKWQGGTYHAIFVERVSFFDVCNQRDCKFATDLLRSYSSGGKCSWFDPAVYLQFSAERQFWQNGKRAWFFVWSGKFPFDSYALSSVFISVS